MTPTADPGSVPGLPESALTAAELQALPADGPDAPWTCRARSLTWLQRAVAPDHGWYGQPLPLCVVSFVEYLDTPVGPYHEVLAAAVLRRGVAVAGQIPFIAVDSLPSVRGGRANWALPKAMAGFEGEVAAARIAAVGAGWSVSVHPRSDPDGRSDPGGRASRAPRLPLRARFSAVGPLGRYTSSLAATGHVVRIRAEVTGPVLGDWLGSGNRLAVVSEGQLRIGAPDGSAGQPRR